MGMHGTANSRNKHKLYLPKDMPVKQGVVSILQYIGKGPYRGRLRLDDRTKCVIVEYMENALPHDFCYAQHAALSVTSSAFRRWIEAAARYRREFPTVDLTKGAHARERVTLDDNTDSDAPCETAERLAAPKVAEAETGPLRLLLPDGSELRGLTIESAALLLCLLLKG